MKKRITLTIDHAVYRGLRDVIGPRRISRFIENLVRPHVSATGLRAAYRQMADDEARESAALDWAEGTCRDVADEKR